MCLGVPGRLTEWLDRDPLLARGTVEFGGVRRECHMACVPEAEVGDYVLVHAGIALSRVDADAAERLLHELRSAGEHLVPPSTEHAE
jgi:hydrogenase expression/formation protein HypC